METILRPESYVNEHWHKWIAVALVTLCHSVNCFNQSLLRRTARAFSKLDGQSQRVSRAPAHGLTNKNDSTRVLLSAAERRRSRSNPAMPTLKPENQSDRYLVISKTLHWLAEDPRGFGRTGSSEEPG
jgi:hypothetical protein